MERTNAGSDIDFIELQYLDLWFANIVDNMNYNLGLIETEVPALVNMLLTLDTAPIQYLRSSLDQFVKDVNDNISDVKDQLNDLSVRIDKLGG